MVLGQSPAGLNGQSLQIGGTLIYSFAPPPKVIDIRKRDDITQNKGAIPLDSRSNRVADPDHSLRRRIAKDTQAL